MPEPNRLYRSKKNRVIAGVAGGLGEYFAIDPILVRVLFVALTFAAFSGPVIYLVLWLITPEGAEEKSPSDATANSAPAGQTSSETNPERMTAGRRIVGLIILLVGIIALGQSFWPRWFIRWDMVWPLAIIAVGILIITRRR